MSYPLSRVKEMFSIAKDVTDAVLNKAFFEAERLDVNPQIKPLTYTTIPADYMKDTEALVGAETILCYYAFARYVKNSTQQSTSTGVVIPTFNNSIVVPSDDRNIRSESEKAKADIFMSDLVCKLKEAKLLQCEFKGQARIWLIK